MRKYLDKISVWSVGRSLGLMTLGDVDARIAWVLKLLAIFKRNEGR